MPPRPCKAARRATIFAVPSTRSFAAICGRSASFNVDLEARARRVHQAAVTGIENRSTPEVSVPIWPLPQFRFAPIELPDGPRLKLSPTFDRGQHPTHFHYYYEPHYKLGFVGNEILTNLDHPLHIRLRRKYDATEKGCLWWAANMFVKSSSKRFIRDEMNRRLRAAFRAALLARGLDERGRKVVDGKIVPLGGLRGTFQMVGKPTMLRAKREDLNKEALWAVDALCRMFDQQKDQNRNAQGRPQAQYQRKPHQSHRRNP